ncbi:MAG: hypothetical protein R2750_02490 [Bacteroidales bacterium]
MNWRKFFVGVIVVIVAFTLAISLNNMLAGMAEAPEEKQKEDITLFVNVEKVTYSTNMAKIVESGRLASQQMVDLSAEVQGQILPGDVLKEGTKFNEGQLAIIKIFDEEAKK